jgi:beta-mannanase
MVWNITWIWCLNVSYFDSTPLKSLYPGNAYVDWTCMDGYNRGTKAGGLWASFSSVFAGTYAELTSSEFEGRSKLIMVGRS